MTEHWN